MRGASSTAVAVSAVAAARAFVAVFVRVVRVPAVAFTVFVVAVLPVARVAARFLGFSCIVLSSAFVLERSGLLPGRNLANRA